MKQQAIDQLKDAIHLGDTFPKRFDNINNATKEGKYGDAKEEVTKWRKQVDILQNQIDNQLSHCKKLRENTILKSLYEEDSSIVVARKSRTVINFLKHDIVNLNNNFPNVAYDLLIGSLSSGGNIRGTRIGDINNDIDDESEDEDFDDDMLGETDFDQEEGKKGENGKKKKKKRKFNEPTKGQLVQKAISTMFQEMEIKRENLEGKVGDDYVDAESLLKLLELRAKMLSNVLFDILKKKRMMDKSFGYDEDFRKLRRPEHGESDEIYKLTEFIKQGNEMIEETHSSRMALAADSEETMHRLVSENKALKRKYAQCLNDRNQFERRLNEYISQKPLSTVDRIAMEEAISERNKIQVEFKKANDTIAKAAVKEELLMNKIVMLTDQVNALSSKLKERTDWFGPHVENLEQTLKHTKKNYNTFKLNVELLSKMYKESLGNLEHMKVTVDDVKKERDVLGNKMSILMKRLQTEKRENIRKDKLIKKVLAAKHAGSEALNSNLQELDDANDKIEVSKSYLYIYYSYHHILTNK